MFRRRSTKIIVASLVLAVVLFVAGILAWQVVKQQGRKKVAVVKGKRIEAPRDEEQPPQEELPEEQQSPAPSQGTGLGGTTGSRRLASGGGESPPLLAPGPPVDVSDTIAPTINVLNPKPPEFLFEGAELDKDKEIWAEVTDNVSVSSAFLYYRQTIDNTADFTRTNMTHQSGSKYKGVIKEEVIQEAYDDAIPISYYVEAEDTSGNKAREPEKPDTYTVVPEGIVVPLSK